MGTGSSTFGLAVALLVGGLLVMLYGVTLNAGESLNTPMLAGGAIVVVAVGVLTYGVMSLEGPATEAH